MFAKQSYLAALVTAAAILFPATAAASTNIFSGYYESNGVYNGQYPKNLIGTGAAAHLNYIVYAFATIKATTNPTTNATTYSCQLTDPNADYMTQYSAANSVNGVADTGSGVQGNWHQLELLRAKYGTKVLISIGGSNTDPKLFAAAASPANVNSFVSSCVNMLIRGNVPQETINGNVYPAISAPGVFDGIDVDWEFPTSADTANYTQLLYEFRTQLNVVNATLTLTAATPGGIDNYQNIQLESAAQWVNYFNVMTYDYAGPWSNTTGFISPLYDTTYDPGSNYSVNTTVTDYLKAGVPANKILLGSEFVSYEWTGVTGGTDGAFGTGTASQAITTYATVVGMSQTGYTKYRDSSSQSPWMFNGSDFWTFEDPTLVQAKVQYAKDNNLGGIMVWNLNGDTATGALTNAITSAMSSTSNNSPDPAYYNFEDSTQGWAHSGSSITSMNFSDNEAFAGRGSLAISFGGSTYSATNQVSAADPRFTPGTVIQLHVWVPSAAKLSEVQAYIEDAKGTLTTAAMNSTSLVANGWNTMSIVVPASAATPLEYLGVKFVSTAAWSGTIYLDSVGSSSDTALYNFESSTQGWTGTGGVTVEISNGEVYAGKDALAVLFGGSNADTSTAQLLIPTVPANSKVQFRIWIPAGSKLTAINPYVEDHSWNWYGDYQAIGSLKAGAWNTLTVSVPSTAATPMQEIGVQFTSSGQWTGPVYIDNVTVLP